MKKLLGLALLVTLFVGCDLLSRNWLPQTPSLHATTYITSVDSSVTEKFLVESIGKEFTRDVESENTYELWLMPVRYGVNEKISHDNVYRIKRFAITDESSYVIPISEFSEEYQSVVFIVETKPDASFEVIGFLTLQIDDQRHVVQFPKRGDMLSEIQFGHVLCTEESYLSLSEKDLSQNEHGFTEDVYLSMQQQTILHNFVLASLNILWNTKENAYYAPGFLLHYTYSEEELSWDHISLYVYSREYEKKAAFFTPQGKQLTSFRAGYGIQSSVQWSADLPVQEFLQSIKKGDLWGLMEQDGNQLAAFDFSVAFVLDTQGNPIVPLVDPTYTVKAEDPTMVDRLYLNWFYLDPDGTKIPIERASDVASLIDTSGLYMDIFYDDPVDPMHGTYMFRPRGEGRCYGVGGDLFEMYDFDAPLPVVVLDHMRIGYPYTFYACNTKLQARLAD